MPIGLLTDIADSIHITEAHAGVLLQYIHGLLFTVSAVDAFVD